MSDQNNSDDKQLEELNAMAREILEGNSGMIANQVSLRAAAMSSGGYDLADTLHNIYLDYGYPAQVSFFNTWNMYRRLGIAKNVVDLPVDTCWSTPPTIKSTNPQFNGEFIKLLKRIKLWDRLKGLDKRQRVGRYAGLYMRIKDGKNPKEPIVGTFASNSLLSVIPLYESQLIVTKSETDPTNDNYGQPVLLEYSQSAVGDRNAEAQDSIVIHASRIVFAAEGADDGWIYGVSALEAVYNSLMDLRKIIGGGAEGFYKNSSQSTVFDLKDGASAVAYKDKLDKFSEQYDDFAQNRSRRAFWTPGMTATTLQSNLITPQEFFNIALNDVASGSGIPATILTGQQTGRLASTEDSSHFLSNQQSRRLSFVSEMVTNVMDWFVQYGVLPSAEFEVEWDDLLARSDQEKLDNGGKMSSINKDQFSSGGQAVFTSEEIREASGFEAEQEEELPDETLDDEILDDAEQ